MKVYVFVLVFLVAVSACNNQNTNRAVSHSANDAAQSNSHNRSHSGMDHSAMVSSPGAAQAPYDLQFIDTMIAHHQGAVDMAKLAEGRVEDEDVKQLAAEIIEDQGAEIAQMSEWRNAWFPEKPKLAMNMDLPGMSHGMGGMDVGKLMSLKGADFDKEFVKQMIPHHEGAIEMAKDLQNRTQRPELKALATAIITDQQSEIEDMHSWAEEWKNE